MLCILKSNIVRLLLIFISLNIDICYCSEKVCDLSTKLSNNLYLSNSIDYSYLSANPHNNFKFLLEYKGGTLWTNLTDIEIYHNVLITSSTHGLSIYDISNYSNIKLISKTYTQNTIYCITLNNSFVFSGTATGLEIYSITSNKKMQFISNYNLNCYVLDIIIEDSIAYLACPESIHIVNISNITKPQLIGKIAVPSYGGFTLVGIIKSGKYLFIASGNMSVINVSDPTRPKLVSSINVPQIAVDLELNDTILYVASLSAIQPSEKSYVCFISVSNPEYPLVLSNYSFQGDLYDIKYENDYLYLGAGINGIAILDVKNPLKVHATGCFASIGEVKHVIPVDNYLFVSSIKPTLNNYNNTTDICSQDSLSKVNYNIQETLEIADFLIFDIFDKSNPFIIGTLVHPGFSTDVTVIDKYAFVIDKYSGVNIIDISVDSFPVISRINCPGTVSQCYVSNNILFLANCTEGVLVYDISKVYDPELLQVYKIPGWISDMDVKGKYAYIASGEEGLTVLDISDPLNITQVNCKS